MRSVWKRQNSSEQPRGWNLEVFKGRRKFFEVEPSTSLWSGGVCSTYARRNWRPRSECRKLLKKQHTVAPLSFDVSFPSIPLLLDKYHPAVTFEGFEIPFILFWVSGFEFRSGNLITWRGFPECLQRNSRTVPRIMVRPLPSVSLPTLFSYRTAKSSVRVAGFWTDIWSQDLRKEEFYVLHRDVVLLDLINALNA